MNETDLSRLFSHMPILQTPRLTLRRMRSGDCEDMYRYASRSEVTRYLLWEPHPDRAYTARYLRMLSGLYRAGQFYDWGVIDRQSEHLIGTCGFSQIDPANRCAEIGYVLSPDYWGKGIAAEALTALLNFAFCELKMRRVEAKYMVENTASRRVMEKCGMTFEGVLRSKLFVKGLFRDIGVCSILSGEYFASPRENLYKKCESVSLIEKIVRRCSKN